MKSKEEQFWSKVEVTGHRGSCWLWTAAKDPQGYGNSYFKLPGIKAHRVAYLLACGTIPEGMHVLHKCDNPPCCNPDHLFLGTQGDNVHDCVAKGRFFPGDHSGEHNGRAKLTIEQVKEIRRRYVRGCNQHQRGNSTQLAKEFGVTLKEVHNVAQGHTWGIE